MSWSPAFGLKLRCGYAPGIRECGAPAKVALRVSTLADGAPLNQWLAACEQHIPELTAGPVTPVPS